MCHLHNFCNIVLVGAMYIYFFIRLYKMYIGINQFSYTASYIFPFSILYLFILFVALCQIELLYIAATKTKKSACENWNNFETESLFRIYKNNFPYINKDKDRKMGGPKCRNTSFLILVVIFLFWKTIFYIINYLCYKMSHKI